MSWTFLTFWFVIFLNDAQFVLGTLFLIISSYCISSFLFNFLSRAILFSPLVPVCNLVLSIFQYLSNHPWYSFLPHVISKKALLWNTTTMKKICQTQILKQFPQIQGNSIHRANVSSFCSSFNEIKYFPRLIYQHLDAFLWSIHSHNNSPSNTVQTRFKHHSSSCYSRV